MEIKHDFDYHQKMINNLTNLKDNVGEHENKVVSIVEILNRMHLEGASLVLEQAISEVEEKLFNTIHPTFGEFIETMKAASIVFEETDNDIGSKIKEN